jgi:RHS repeat-associated protein
VLADENLLEDDVFWALADHLGTVRRLVDNAGNAIRDRIFSAWGQVVEDTNPTFAYPFAFTGREYDPETGLYYYRARYYDPHTGRFLSEDPLGFAAGDTNLSRYVFNSPANYTDPTGLQPPATARNQGVGEKNPFDEYIGPNGLIQTPVWDYYATGTLNEANVNQLHTEAEALLVKMYAKYLWTQEKMRRWFELEQAYGNENERKDLADARQRLLTEFERITAFINTKPKKLQRVYRRQFQIYFQTWRLEDVNRKLAPEIQQRACRPTGAARLGKPPSQSTSGSNHPF